MKKKDCSTCLFWVQYVDGQGDPIYGECHRFPPTSQRVPSERKEMFPAVFEWVKNWPRPDVNDWCGEWSAKCVQTVSGHSNAEQR